MRRPSRHAACAAVLLALVVGPAGPGAGPAAAATPACADVLYVGARGSGQPQAGSAYDGGTGMGVQVHSAYTVVAQRLSGRRSTASVALVYPAHGGSVLLRDPARWFAGLEEGRATLKRTLLARARQCPAERLVLAGYSQGAMLVHRVLRDLGATDATAASRAVLARVDGALLVSDGDRVPLDRVNLYGTAPASAQGLGLFQKAVSGSTSARFGAGRGARVHSVCMRRDPVCDSTGDPSADLAYAEVHTGYRRTPEMVAAASAVAEAAA